MLKYFFILIGCLSFSAYAQIYQWHDGQGNVYFSDQPKPGVKKITLTPTSSFSVPAQAKTKKTPVVAEPKLVVTEYKQFEIVSPKNKETFQNQRKIEVEVAIDPELAEGDQLQLVLDGKAIGKPQDDESFTLNNIDRGTHGLSVQLLNKAGKVIKTTPTVTIYVHYASRLN